LNAWILNHKVFGQIIHDYRVDKSITLHAKVISITMLWIFILSSVFLALNGKMWLQVLLLSIATGVTIHILRFKTKHKN